ncbi:MAG: four helix bundle protein [Prevotella sp.]|nr:four helix bundle protein [Prevotella sp.]
MRDKNEVLSMSKTFALRIIKLYKYLTEQKKEFVLSKQILRSGTSIGANIREAINGQSKADFLAKMNISLKEAAETEYWLELLTEGEFLPDEAASSIMNDCKQLNKILVSIVKTTSFNIENNNR